MKKIYAHGAVMPRSETLNTDAATEMAYGRETFNEKFKLPDDLNDDFEAEVKNLYMWTQNLSVNDDEFLNSPRLQSSL